MDNWFCKGVNFHQCIVCNLLKAVNKLGLNEKLWSAYSMFSRIAFDYTDYEWNMTIGVFEQFLQEI